jgi:ubiquinone/menaquinone biosynthesis C-methylase UbiE
MVWKEQFRRNKESNPSRDWPRLWEERERALKFWALFQENRERVDWALQGTDMTPTSKVLDIGSGPGILAIPFAKKVRHVTAVEPAEGMVSILKEKMAEHSVQNITIVKKRWEDVNVNADLQPPYDVVIASFSLGMPEIRAAIDKMLAVSSKYVYLYWFAGDTSWDIHFKEIWPLLHSKVYYPEPKCNIIFNLLYQMGIYPNVEVFNHRLNQRFSSLPEALDALRSQYRIETESQEVIFRDYLSGLLEKENGSLVLPGFTIRVKIWWKNDRNYGNWETK